MAKLRQLTALADGSTIRTATFDGASHLVVPVVAMVGNRVVFPTGAEGPEFVPIEVLAIAPGGWDGRPAVPDHPGNGTESANTPTNLETRRIGLLFNTRLDGGKLKTEAWIDPARREQVGDDAADVLARLEAGEVIEVSIGAWVTTEPAQGIHDGQSYTARWTDVVPDHLALLTSGREGACSVDMGCGAPRAAQLRCAVRSQARRPKFSGTESNSWTAPTFKDYVRYLDNSAEPPANVRDASATLRRAIASHTLLGDPEATNFRDLSFFPCVRPSSGRLNENALRAVLGGRGSQAEIPDRARESAQDMARRLLNSEFDAELETAMNQTQPATMSSRLRSAFSRAFDLLSRSAEDGVSDVELRDALWSALRAVEPAFDYILEVYPDDETVIYQASPDEMAQLFRRTYSTADDGAVTLADDRVEVKQETNYVPAESGAPDTAEPRNAADSPPCGCQPGEGQAAPAPKKGVAALSDKAKDLVGRLIASERSPFTDEDTEVLTGFPVERLEALVEHCAAEVPEPEPEPTSAAEPDDAPTPQTVEEYLADPRMPGEIREALGRSLAEEKTRRTALIGSITKATDEWSAEALAEESTVELERKARALKAAVPAPDYTGQGFPADPDVNSTAPPDGWNISGLQGKEAN